MASTQACLARALREWPWWHAHDVVARRFVASHPPQCRGAHRRDENVNSAQKITAAARHQPNLSAAQQIGVKYANVYQKAPAALAMIKIITATRSMIITPVTTLFLLARTIIRLRIRSLFEVLALIPPSRFFDRSIVSRWLCKSDMIPSPISWVSCATLRQEREGNEVKGGSWDEDATGESARQQDEKI
jgi:hypothetical protein